MIARERERKAKGRMEGGVDHLILCSKKTEMLSSNVSRL